MCKVRKEKLFEGDKLKDRIKSSSLQNLQKYDIICM